VSEDRSEPPEFSHSGLSGCSNRSFGTLTQLFLLAHLAAVK